MSLAQKEVCSFDFYIHLRNFSHLDGCFLPDILDLNQACPAKIITTFATQLQ